MRPISEGSLQNVERSKFSRFFDTQSALDKEFEQCPIPEPVDLIGPWIASRSLNLRCGHCSCPAMKSEGADLRHLSFKIKNGAGDTGARAGRDAFPPESVRTKRAPLR